jgi:hypothetical protein
MWLRAVHGTRGSPQDAVQREMRRIFVCHFASGNNLLETCVVKGGRRPRIKRSWPPLTKQVLQQAWSASQEERPSMETICARIQKDLEALEGADIVNARSRHIMNISAHSFQFQLSELQHEPVSHPARL